MTRALYLIGAPGTGKTTLLAAWTARYKPGPAQRLHRLLWAEPLTLAGQPLGYRLGQTRHPFGGTDTLGMAVNPDAVEWAAFHPLPPLVCGEGARLANTAFLVALAARTRLLVVHLTADTAHDRQTERAQRHGLTPQSEAWTKGATTRATNLAHRLPDLGVDVAHLDTTHLTPAEASTALTALAQAAHSQAIA